MNEFFNEVETYTKISAPSFMVNNPRWIDTSWHNDVTASAEFRFPDRNTGKELSIRVWVADDNPSEREISDFPKFMVEVDNEDGDNIMETPNDDYYLACETEKELKQIICMCIAKFA